MDLARAETIGGCLVLVLATGLSARWGEFPPGLVLSLLAAGLGLGWRQRLGRLVTVLSIGLLVGGSHQRTEPGWEPDRPVEMRLEVQGPWRQDADGSTALCRSLWVRQGLRMSKWRQPLVLRLSQGVSRPETKHLQARGYLRRSVPSANGAGVRRSRWILRVKSNHFLRADTARGRAFERLGQSLGIRLRQRLESRLQSWEASRFAGGSLLVRVLVLGQTDRLPESVSRGLRAAGLSHLVALSGLHLGILAAMVFLGTSRAAPRLRFVLAPLVALAYLWLAGPRPSLVRASLMLLAVLAAWHLRRPPRPVLVLGWAAAAMVLSYPHIVESLGFQLTFAATGGILLLTRSLERRWIWIPGTLRSSLCVSVAAHLAVLPWSLSVFHLVNPWSPLWNLLAVPWAALSLCLAFSWVVLALLLPGFEPVLRPLLASLAAPLQALGHLPPLTLGSFPASAGPLIACCIAAALTAALLVRGRRRSLMVAVAVVLLLHTDGETAARPELVMLDVGQGEAILLRDGRRAMLIDGGGWRRGDIAQRILLPALTRLGVRRLDGVILSHPDTDHCQGLNDLLSYMRVERVYTGPGWLGNRCVDSLLLRTNIPVRVLWRGERLEWLRWNLEVLHPRAGNRSGRNNRSLVLLAETSGLRALLVGDLEGAGERQILAAKAPGPVDVLKVGHHGSDTSSSAAWLRALRPRLALISCGPGNRYGHPHRRVLARLATHGGSLVLRTDRCGMISLTSDPWGRLRLRFPGQPRDTH